MKSIVVFSKLSNLNRDILIGGGVIDYPATGDLSSLELDSIIKIIEKLTLLVNSTNPNDYYYGVLICV